MQKKWWSPISSEATDLISKMLTVDTEKRVNARQAMRHPWFLKDDSSLMEHNLEQSLKQFKSWNAKRKFKGAVKAVMSANKMKKLISGMKSAAEEEESASNRI